MVNERHNIYIKRRAGEPAPWSDDVIFQNWKFCNVFRQLDRQSEWLIQNVIEPHSQDDYGLLLFNIFLFRAFNLNSTYEALINKMGKNGWIEIWDENRAIQTLRDQVIFWQKPLTSGAYMIRGYQNKPKWQSIPETMSDVWIDKDALAKMFSKDHRIQLAQSTLQSQGYWGWGPFTCYQIALDLTYTPILEQPLDINDWCVFGPGGHRGLEIIFENYHEAEKRISIDLDISLGKWLTQNQGMHLADYMPIMTLQDIEFSLCEFQKYWRVMNGGRAKEKYNATGKV